MNITAHKKPAEIEVNNFGPAPCSTCKERIFFYVTSSFARLSMLTFACFLPAFLLRAEENPPAASQGLVIGSNVITDESLCGPISLSLAAKKLGINVEVTKIAEMVKLDPSGTSMSELGKAAQGIGLQAIPYRLHSADSLLKLSDQFPAIVLVRSNHFVVVWPAGDNQLSIAEYPLPLRQISPLELAQEWDPKVLVLSRPGSRDPFSRMSPLTSVPVVVSICAGVALLFAVVVWRRRPRLKAHLNQFPLASARAGPEGTIERDRS